MSDHEYDAFATCTEVSTVLLDRERAAAASAAKTGYLRVFAARWLAPVAVIAGIALAGQSVFRLDTVFGAQPVAIASVGGLRAVFSSAASEPMPAELIVYDAVQYQNFNTGIARFSDSDLLEYAVITARDLGGIEDLMTPYMLDVLLLTHREIDRRGLARPFASAAHEHHRESLRALHAETSDRS